MFHIMLDASTRSSSDGTSVTLDMIAFITVTATLLYANSNNSSSSNSSFALFRLVVFLSTCFLNANGLKGRGITLIKIKIKKIHTLVEATNFSIYLDT